MTAFWTNPSGEKYIPKITPTEWGMNNLEEGDELVRREDAVNHGAEKWEKAREYERNRVCRSFKDWMEEENPSQEEILEKFEEWGALDSKEKPGEVDE